MTKPAAFALAVTCLMAACGAPEQSKPVNLPSVDQTRPVPDPAPTQLTQAAEQMKARILTLTKRDSLRGFADLAEEMPGFASNFDGVDHYQHWYLLRRTGVDPLHKIEDLFEEPFGVRQIGDEYWFIWPDFAALDAADLVPAKLTFKDRVRLQELVGEEGIAALRSGGLFPGLRTAISDNGRWVYYVNDIGESERAQ